MASKQDFEQVIADVHDEPNHALQVNVVAGTVQALNPSVSLSGNPVPAYSTEIAGKDGSGNLVPVSVDSSGKVNVNLSTASIEIGKVDQGTPASTGNAWPVKPTDGTNSQSYTASGEAKVSVTQPLPTGTNSIGNIGNVTGTISLPTGAATETTLSTLNGKSAGALVPTAYNEVDLTYVPSGNGVGQVQTAVYKLSGSTVKTLTLSYDGSNRLSSVVAS